MSTVLQESSASDSLTAWLGNADAEKEPPDSPEMNRDDRVFAYTFLGYLGVELNKRYHGWSKCTAWCDNSETKAAFDAARDDLRIMLSAGGWNAPTLRAGITANAVATLLWEELEHKGYTQWARNTVGAVLGAVHKVRDGLAVTAM